MAPHPACPPALSGRYRPFVREAVTQHVRQERVWSRPLNSRFELWCVREGTLRITRSDGSNARVPEGEVVLLQPGSSGDLLMSRGCAYHRLRFDLLATENLELFDERPGPAQPDLQYWWEVDIPLRLDGPLAQAAIRAQLRIADLYWRDALAHEQANQHLGSWVLDLVRQFSAQEGPRAKPEGVHDQLRTLAYEMATRGTSVSECAEVWGMSRSHFTRFFERMTGVSPGEFMRHARVEEAKKRLLKEDLPLERVARGCGYKSAHALVQQFKAVTGTTPKAWQRGARDVGSD